MSQPAESPVRNRGRRRRVWLFAVWAATAATLWWVWPMRPRLTLGDGENVRIVGITPDSRRLVALTRRAGLVNRNGEPKYPPFWSGPIQVWDLQTGERRSIGLPGQSDSGVRVPTSKEFLLDELVDPDAHVLEVACPPDPFRDGLLHLVQTNRADERWSVAIDLAKGTTTRVRMPAWTDLSRWRTSSSRSGRWCVEQPLVDDSQNRYHQRLQVIDTHSGAVVIDFDAVDGIYSHCFSEDETLLAFNAGNSSANNSTHVWRLEPLEQLLTIPRGLGGLAFSPDKKWLASADYGGVEVFDVATGRVTHQFPVDGAQLRKPAFTVDGSHVIAYRYFRGGGTGMAPKHCLISEIHVWNLRTGGYASYLSPKFIDFYDPNLCGDGWSDQTTPLIVGDKERLFDVLTGKTIFVIPPGTTAETLSPSARTVILQRQLESKLNRMLDRLAQWNVPIPALMWQDEHRSELLVCDVLTRRIRASLPFDDTWVTPAHLVLSPDERTLITVSHSDPPVISVWDFPPRRPFIRPFAWSLLIPTILVLWSRWRRRLCRSVSAHNADAEVSN